MSRPTVDLSRTLGLARNPLASRLHWPQMLFLLITPLVALYGVVTTEIVRATVVFGVVYYVITGLGITAGYHRFWAHKAYDATPVLQWALMFAGSGAVQGSIRWWARGHRAHHKFTDTDKDPYGAHRGLLWSHIVWMFFKPSRIGSVPVDDLDESLLVRWQHKHYLVIAIISAYLVPMVVAGLGWGDWRGGLFFAGILRMVFVQHATFCINSLAHYLGSATYDDTRTPRDHLITALITLGEGHHNFHHEFPNDYRNGIKAYHYDPTKWFIALMQVCGLAYNLKRAPQDIIDKGRLLMQEKELSERREKMYWGNSNLPKWTSKQFQSELETKRLIIINNFVHDVSEFDHPGGVSLMKAYSGKDATKAFNGQVYLHSTAARNMAALMRVAEIPQMSSKEE